MKLAHLSLGELLAVSDSGTWGDEGEPGVSDAVLRSTNIQDSRLVLDDVAWRVVPVKDRERRVLKTGDILVTKSSGSPDHIGKCCLFVEPPGDRRYYFSNFTLRLRADRLKADPRWVFYWLSSVMGRDVLTRINNTTTGLRNLDVGRYLAQQIPTPPLPEQRRIADILDKADAIRRKRKEAIALTEELLRSAFLEMFGDPVTNPKGWEVIPLGETLAEDPRIGTLVPADDDGEQLVVRVGELGGYDVALQKCKRVSLEGKELERFRLEVGDVVLARAIGSEDHLGKASVLQSTTETVTFDSHVMRLRFLSQRLQPYFFLQWLRSEGGRHLFMREAGRTAVQFNVNAKQIARVAIPVPDIGRQREFVELLQAVRRTRATQLEYLNQSDALFAALVRRAFCGELTGTHGPSKPQLGLFDASGR